MSEKAKFGKVYNLGENKIDFSAFKVADVSVFDTNKLNALEKLGIKTVEDLRKFRNMINVIISDIRKYESAFFSNLTAQEIDRLLALKLIKINKTYDEN